MNTTKHFLLCILCMTLSLPAFGQNKEIEKITAVKFSAAVGEQYFKKIMLKAFSVDKNNILRPSEGFKITYFPSEKKIAIHPKTMKLTSTLPSNPSFDIEEVPGGTMFCLCDQVSDDCKIQIRIAELMLAYDCIGSCGCGSFIIYTTSEPIREYETAGGRWFNF